MDKTELKTGYIVTLRNEMEMMVIKDCEFDGECLDILLDKETGAFELLTHTLDLSYPSDSDYDIMRVGIKNFDTGARKILWERKALTKGSLQNGCIAVLRNGTRMMVMKDFKGSSDVLIDFQNNEYDTISAYDNNLQHRKNSDWDIVNVEMADNPNEFIGMVLGEE